MQIMSPTLTDRSQFLGSLVLTCWKSACAVKQLEHQTGSWTHVSLLLAVEQDGRLGQRQRWYLSNISRPQEESTRLSQLRIVVDSDPPRAVSNTNNSNDFIPPHPQLVVCVRAVVSHTSSWYLSDQIGLGYKRTKRSWLTVKQQRVLWEHLLANLPPYVLRQTAMLGLSVRVLPHSYLSQMLLEYWAEHPTIILRWIIWGVLSSLLESAGITYRPRFVLNKLGNNPEQEVAQVAKKRSDLVNLCVLPFGFLSQALLGLWNMSLRKHARLSNFLVCFSQSWALTISSASTCPPAPTKLANPSWSEQQRSMRKYTSFFPVWQRWRSKKRCVTTRWKHWVYVDADMIVALLRDLCAWIRKSGIKSTAPLMIVARLSTLAWEAVWKFVESTVYPLLLVKKSS